MMAIMNFDAGQGVRQASLDALKDAPAGWLETLQESDEDIAAGQVVPVDEILKELDKMIAGMDTNPASKP